jgi:hypothetical protein
MQRDGDGHRNYRLTVRIESDSTLDGPANALLTPGLPVPGSVWAYDDDYDPWAFCHFDAEIEQVVADEPNYHWDATFLFTTKPLRRCADQHFEDPLLEPMIVSGAFSNQHVEAARDRFGLPVLTSTHELIRGTLNEWAVSYPIIRVRQNVAALQLPLLALMIDRVNVAPLWGMARREIRLASVSWEQKFYGTCSYYYERNLEFHVKYGTFDREILDECSKVLHGHWDAATGNWILDNIAGAPPNRFDPTHFIDFTDRQNNPVRGIMNGKGVPAKVVIGKTDTNRYVSIVNGQVGQKLSDATQWIPLNVTEPFAFPYDNVSEWEPGLTYARGQVTFVDTIPKTYFVAIDDVTDVVTAPAFNADWLSVDPLLDKGTYSAVTTYDVGNYVTAVTNVEAEGNIHVEYYDEGDFLLLGIPLTVGL